jgi:hypothetical protein
VPIVAQNGIQHDLAGDGALEGSEHCIRVKG